MPSWKKVIVSGSDARFATLFTSGHVTASANISGSGLATASFGKILGDGSEITNVPTNVTVEQASDPTHNTQHYITFVPNNNGGIQNTQTFASLKYLPSTDTIWSKVIAAVRPRVKYTNNSDAINILGSSETRFSVNTYDSSSNFEAADNNSPITMKPGIGSIQATLFEGPATKPKYSFTNDSDTFNIMIAGTSTNASGQSDEASSFKSSHSGKPVTVQPSTGTVGAISFKGEGIQLRDSTISSTYYTTLNAGNIGGSRIISLPDQSGTVMLTSDAAGTVTLAAENTNADRFIPFGEGEGDYALKIDAGLKYNPNDNELLANASTATALQTPRKIGGVNFDGTSDILGLIVSSSAQIADDISGSFTEPSSSFSSRVTTLETNISTQPLNTTDSPRFAGMNVDGDLTARRLIISSSVSIITSSFSSGSTLFGDDILDTHRFSGSVSISGSIMSNGLNVLSSSAMIADDISGSFTAPSQSIDTTIKSVSSSLDNYITTTSASLQDRISAEHNNRLVFTNTSKKLRNDQYTPTVAGHVDGSKAALQLQSPGGGTSMTLWVTGSANWFIKNSVGALTTPVSPSNYNNMIFGTTTGTPQPTSQNNIALGHYSYGGNNSIQGTYNASFGTYALYEARSISHNTAIGYGTGQELVSGSYNTFLGLGAGGKLDGGGNLGAASKASSSYNTMVGAYAGYYYREDRDHLNESLITNSVNFRSGSKSVYVGYGARPGQENPKYETVIGPFTSGHGSYTSTIGTGSLYVSTDGDGDIYAGTFTGSALLVSGNVSGSQTGSFGRLEVNTGIVNGDFNITDDLIVTDDAQVGGVFSATGNTILGNAQTDTHTFTGHITASGNISASGTVFASKFESAGESNEVISFNDNLNITGNISASGHISGSSTSTGSFGTINIAGDWTNTGNVVANLGEITTVDINGGTIDGTTIATSNITVGNSKTLDVSAGTLTLANDQISGDKVEGGTIASTTITTLTSNHITASGHISGSSLSTGSFGAITISGMSVPNVVDVSSSLATRINSIETSTISGVTSSLGIKGGADFGPATFSIDFSDTEFQTGISGSLGPNANLIRSLTEAGITGSWTPRVTVLEGLGYAQGVGTGNSPEFENLTLRGTLRAKEFIVSSSVTHMTRSFSSGSNVFGDTHDDTHQFTGSIISSGSITAPIFTGIFSGALSSSAQIADDISGSLGTNANLIRSLTASGISGSLGTNADLIRSLTASGITGSFTETSASISTRLTNVEVNVDDDMTFAGDSGGDLVIDFDSEKFTIAGGTNATTVGSGNTITVNVDDAFLINSGDDTTSGKITAGGFNTTGHVTASGNISGSSTSTGSFGHVKIPDDGQLSIGGESDLILYHDGSNSYIKDAGTGNLNYMGGTQTFQNAAGSKTMMVLNAANSVDLHYDNTKKFETAPLGVNVTGRLYASSHITGSGNISGSATSTGSFGRVEIADNANVVGDLSSNKLTVNNIVLDNNTISTTGDLTLSPDGDDILVENNNIVGTGHIKDFTRISGSAVSTGSMGRLDVKGDIVPTAHNNSDLGSPTNRWANVYSADLQLSNLDNDKGNEIDGTKGSWTIQEGDDDLYLLNRKNGKKYKFKLEEIT